jgi:sigma-B regulation protein RsbQ
VYASERYEASQKLGEDVRESGGAGRRRCELLMQRGLIASEEVGRFVPSRIPGSAIVFLNATGHCPNLSAKAEAVSAIRAYV